MNAGDKLRVKCPWCSRNNAPATVKFGINAARKNYIHSVYICPCGDEYDISLTGRAAAKVMEAMKWSTR